MSTAGEEPDGADAAVVAAAVAAVAEGEGGPPTTLSASGATGGAIPTKLENSGY